MNDGACDPQGRFWAGTMADDHHAGGGALYRLDQHGRTELMLSDLTISNGLGWSPDGSTMYLVDSGPRVVYAFAFDRDHGTISDRRVLVTVAEEVGAPDGMTVDAAGDLWVAIYGGGRVHRYSPDGVLRQAITVPAKQTTCCGFAGPGLNRLYVTTATENWSDEQRRAEPAAGLVYRFDTDATGLPATPFQPGPRLVAEGDLVTVAQRPQRAQRPPLVRTSRPASPTGSHNRSNQRSRFRRSRKIYTRPAEPASREPRSPPRSSVQTTNHDAGERQVLGIRNASPPRHSCSPM